MEEENNYAGSSKFRPEPVEKGGKGMYCCIPECKSSSYTSDMEKTGIGFFKFPSDKTLHKTWKGIVNRYRRKGKGDDFKINSNTVVCEFHFNPKDIRITMGRGIKKLRTGAIPTIFSFKPAKKLPTRKSPRKRTQSIDKNYQLQEQFEENHSTVVDPRDEEINELQHKIVQLENENTILKDQLKKLQNSTYNYENISKDEKLFKSETGLTKDSFDKLFTLLDVKDNCDNIKMYDSKFKTSDTKISSPLSKKQGPKMKMTPFDQLFLVMTWLKGGFSLKHSAWLFGITSSSASRYIITWINLIYFTLGAIPIWPSKQQLMETMPKSFKDTYPTTRCIIDCTELFCQRPSSLATQSHMYSHYKSHVTYKGLIGVAPSGAVTFVSQLYEGCISDKEIVERSGILNKNLWEAKDSIMADRGFTITDLLKPLGVELNIPSFLDGRKQFTEKEVKESQTIASVRIHVERAIQRIKKFKQIRNEIPLTLHGSINQIWTVACLLCNLMSPLIQKDA